MARKIVSTAAFNFRKTSLQINASSTPISLIKQTGVIPGGFPYVAFNGDAKVRPETLTNAVETVRAIVFSKTVHNDHTFLHANKLYKDYFMFISAGTLEIDPKLYDHTICKAPLLFDIELDHIGKTSSQTKTSFYLDGMPDPLFVSRVSTVLVCNKMRVPKSPPDWWVEKYKSCFDAQVGGKSIGQLKFSGRDDSQTTESQFKVSSSECDTYGHTNWSHYIRYCNDAFAEHRTALLGEEGFEECFRSVRCFSIYYQKESSVGDVLTVKTSPENSSAKDDIFYFDIVDKNKNLVFQSKIEYFPSEK